MTSKAPYGFVSHACEPIGQTLFVPVWTENYNSRLVVSAHCAVCGARVFERQVDKAVAPAKGSYMTV